MRVYDVIRLSEIRERVAQLHVAENYNDDLDFLLERYDDLGLTSEEKDELEDLRERCEFLEEDVTEAESNASYYEEELWAAQRELEDLKDELTGFVEAFQAGKIVEEQIKKWEERL